MRQHLVVVGGGQAAAQSIQSARQLGFDGRISLIAAELHLPYQRPPLSKTYLAGTLASERLRLRPESFYASREVELHLGRSATLLDAGKRRLDLDDGSTLRYDALLLATGSRVRELELPGSRLDGVHYLRTLDDVDRLRVGFKAGRRLVIIGGGYIGLEVAAVASSFDMEVIVIEAAERVLARVASPELAAFFAGYHRARGVQIHCNSNVSAFTGRSRITGVATNTGRHYEADLVLIAVGIVPNIELALDAGLECSIGIHVDQYARTGAPSIFAAGDCTAHRHPQVGRLIRLESVQNAIEQGKAAAGTVAGQPRPFDEVPWFWSDQYDLKLQIAGLALDYDATIVRGNMQENSFCIFYLAGGRPVAVDAVNRPRDFMLARKLVAAKLSAKPQELADSNFDLSQYLVLTAD
jgi:3-phenylpropionate/trans-cinnamate dioxygenase ferredoxin reductase subunit